MVTFLPSGSILSSRIALLLRDRLDTPLTYVGGLGRGIIFICACTLPRSLGSRLWFLYAYGHYGVTKGNHIKAGYVVSEMALNMYFTIVYI